MPEQPKSGYASYAAFVKDELAAQDARKASFEQRGITVITTSGALATLLLGLAALSTKKADTFVLPHPADTYLAISLVLFAAAAVLALLTNLPMNYDTPTVDALKERVNEAVMGDEDAAEKDIALTRIKNLKTAKEKNTTKAWLLIAALAGEVLAVGFVAAAVWIIIT